MLSLFEKKITLVVACKANITRSAYLHGYMEKLISERYPHARRKIRIQSAGVQACSRALASAVVRHVARLNGFSLSSHSSSPFTKKMVKRADAILVMEENQKEQLIKRYPFAKDKIYLIMEYLWSGNPEEVREIPDPTGRDTEDYQMFIEVAHAEVERIFRELAHKGTI